MKTQTNILLAAVLLSFAGCEEKPKPVGEKIKDNVNDALDRRPNEKLRDAGEDLKDAGKDAKQAVKDAVRE